MKQIKRILAVVFAFSFLLTAVVGCGTPKGNEAAPAASADQTTAAASTAAQDQTPKANVEVQFWDMVWGGPAYIELAGKLVDQYNEQHPGVTVKYQSTPWTNWYQTFATAIASGSAPDVSTGAGYQAFQFSKIGGILPIDDVVEAMKNDGSLADFDEAAVEMLKYDGHYVAIPWNVDIRTLWYNKDVLDKAGLKPPATWDELRSVAKAATKDGVYGFSVPGAQTGGIHVLLTMMINNGGGLFDKDGKVDVLNDRNKETFKFISDMAKDGSINPASAGYTGDDNEKAFISGKSAMIIAGSAMDEKFPEMKGKIFVAPPLTGLHGDKGTLNWINNIMMYKDSKHQPEAKEFLKWWSQNQKPLFTEGGITSLPARKSFASEPKYKDDVNNNMIVTQYMPVGKTTAANAASLFPELNEIEGDTVLMKAMQGLIMKKEPEAMLNEVNTGINNIMSKSK